MMLEKYLCWFALQLQLNKLNQSIVNISISQKEQLRHKRLCHHYQFSQKHLFSAWNLQVSVVLHLAFTSISSITPGVY